jgi:hypothetical protein
VAFEVEDVHDAFPNRLALERFFDGPDGQGKTDQFANSKNGFQDVMKKQPKKLKGK